MVGGYHIDLGPNSASLSLHGVPPDILLPGAAIWSGEPLIRVGPRTIIIGRLFRRGTPSTSVLTIGQAEADRLMDDRGRGLLGGYWGGYVVVHVGPDDAVRIFRDPSGLLPCYFRIGAEGVALGGTILNLAAPGPDAVDFPELACILAGGDLRGRKTCLAGVEELIAGECLVFDRGRATTEPWWSPWDHVGGSGIGSEDAVVSLVT